MWLSCFRMTKYDHFMFVVSLWITATEMAREEKKLENWIWMKIPTPTEMKDRFVEVYIAYK